MTPASWPRALFTSAGRPGQVDEITAAGFDETVVGVMYTAASPPTLGMPLGSLDTGCVDIEACGTLGLCTLFNSHVPRRGPMNLPFLGVAIDDAAWVLATHRFQGFDLPGRHGYRMPGQVRFAEHIEYWGHYPVVDLQYRTDAPVAIALRAWSAFLPGDLAASNTPAACFDLHLTNTSQRAQAGTVAFSFPGPSEPEAGGLPLEHRPLRQHTDSGERVEGVEVHANAGTYVIAIPGGQDVRHGGELGMDAGAWRRMPYGLPSATSQPGASVTTRFKLEPGKSTVVTIILAWYFPHWTAAGNPDPAALAQTHGYRGRVDENATTGAALFTHMYARRFSSARDVALSTAERRHDLLGRILAWQGEIYRERALPGWLRDGLVNSLHLITETGFWAAAQPPIGDWCQSQDGLFGMNEDPRHCPQIECVPCSFYGNYPIVYFFPQLALSTLRAYRAYQFPDGEVAWIFGGMTADPPTLPVEMTAPDRGYQTTLNGACVVDMVYRYWLRTAAKEHVVELYPMVRRATEFTMNLRAEDGADGIISFPTGNKGLEWFEACTWAGMAAHVGGIHLAQLRQAQALATLTGDNEFAQKCQGWFEQGSRSMEGKMWTGDYYLNYHDQATGDSSDLIMANQLDGEWMTRMAGLPGVFRADRVSTTLATIARTCVSPDWCGPVNFTDTTGRPTTSGEGRPDWNYDPYAFFVPEALMLAATYLFEGERDLGLEIAARCWTNLVAAGLTWDQPNLFHAATGQAIYGGDYYQNMIIWALPAAIEGADLGAPAREGGLVAKVIAAAGGHNR